MKRGREDEQGSDGEEVNPVIRSPLDQSIRRRSSWKRAPPSWRQLNVCGGPSSYGYCIRDSDGKLDMCGVKWVEPSQAVLGLSDEYREAEALYYGLQKALDFGYKKLVAECPCYSLVKKIKVAMIQDLESEQVVTNILELRNQFDSFIFAFVKPDGNSVAYEMSKLTVDGWKTGHFPEVASHAASWDVRCSLDNQRESQEKVTTKLELPAPSMSSGTQEASSPDENIAESQNNPGAASIAWHDSDTIP
ncbi:uncharacterized protein [Spinacia oleracea]|uniref:RNase H type-1 domain-containing protein n=1 Tax=Spinacia oleracea TaxID=3562 RepID=A0ABM3R5H3_SPIOL|nr:uncharacterized protein LOC130466191 [Spinacia oleracea]